MGLVDGLGGFQRALRSVKLLVGADPDEKILVRTYRKQLSWLERTMLDALRSHGEIVVATQVADPLVGIPEPLAGAARALARCGFADIAPLLDGRPLTLMTWREMQRQDPLAGP